MKDRKKKKQQPTTYKNENITQQNPHNILM